MKAEIDWDAKVKALSGVAFVHPSGTVMGNCGLISAAGFGAQPAPTEDDVKKAESDARYSWKWVVAQAIGTYGEGTPECLRYIKSHCRQCETEEQYVKACCDYVRKQMEGSITVEEACEKIYTQLVNHMQGRYHMYVFSGCVSEYIPRFKGRGAYHRGLHAGTFAEWIKKRKDRGVIVEGPIALNENHNSAIRGWFWVPPMCRGWADYEDAERQVSIHGPKEDAA